MRLHHRLETMRPLPYAATITALTLVGMVVVLLLWPLIPMMAYTKQRNLLAGRKKYDLGKN